MIKITKISVIALIAMCLFSCKKENIEDIEESFTFQYSGNYCEFGICADDITIYWGDGKTSDITMKGIGDFLKHSYDSVDNSLHTIHIKGTNITYLEFSLYSQDYNLRDIDLSECLKAIDVSKLINLSVLNISGNAIQNLNLSKNTNLSWLNINHSAIQNLDLSKNMDLEYIYCGNNNNLKKLIFSKSSKYWEVVILNNANLTEVVMPKLESCPNLVYICFNNNNLSTSVINHIFENIPKYELGYYVTGFMGELYYGNIHVQGNVGAADCNAAIAENKGWIVRK